MIGAFQAGAQNGWFFDYFWSRRRDGDRLGSTAAPLRGTAGSIRATNDTLWADPSRDHV